MLIGVIFLFAVCEAFVSAETWSPNPWDLDPFFQEQYYKTLDYIDSLKGSKRHKRDAEQLDIVLKSVLTEGLSKSQKVHINTMMVYGERQILLQDNIFRLHEHDDGNLFVEFGHILNILSPVLMLETTEFGKNTMILMGYRDHSQLYILPHKANRDWKGANLQQTFSSETNRPSAAKFLNYNNELLLVIIYKHRRLERVNSIIYLWTGTHFDEIYSMATEGGTDLAVVEEETHFLFIVAQSSPNKKIGSEVYKFVPRMGVYKHQEIESHLAFKSILYKNRENDQTYLLLLNRNGKSRIQRLTKDGEFLPCGRHYDFRSVTAAKDIVVEEKTLIALAVGNKFEVYVPEEEYLEIIFTTILPDSLKIFSIDYIKPANGTHTFLLLSRSSKGSVVNLLSFDFNVDYIVSDQGAPNPFDCLNAIQALLDERQQTVDDISQAVEKFLTMDGALIDGTLNTSVDITLVNSKIGTININPDEQLSTNTKVLRETAATVDEAVNRLEEEASHIVTKDGPIEFKSRLEISGDLIVENLTAKYLDVDAINGKPFITKSFLFNNATQYIPESWLNGKSISAKNLKSSLFDDYLSSASVFSTLTAQDIRLVNKKSINDIELDDIVLRDHKGTIMGTKTFERLTAYEVDTERLGKVCIGAFSISTSLPRTANILFVLNPNNGDLLTDWIERSLNEVSVRNLNVEGNASVSQLFTKGINGIDLNQLMESTFQKGTHVKIEGNLTFLSNLSVKNLNVESINNTRVDDFMTKTTPQTINSRIKARNVLARSIDTKRVNGVDLKTDVALVGRHNTIRSPTTIFNLDVTRDLQLNCGPENQTLCNFMPTKQEELLQIYNGPVTIVGSLSVPDLKFTKRARMTVDGEPFTTDVESQYWMKDRSQIIRGNVTFRRGLSAPQVSAETVNQNFVEDIYSTSNDARNVRLTMRNVEVRNNVDVPDNTGCSRIKQISREAVRNTGLFRISGRKRFSGRLEVDNLRTQFVNDLDMNDVVMRSNQNINFAGEARFETVHIKGDLAVDSNFAANLINGLNFTDFYHRSLKIDEPATLNMVSVQNGLYAEKLSVREGRLSNVPGQMNDALSGIGVRVKGDLHASKIDGVDTVNGMRLERYLSMVVQQDRPHEIYGRKYFKNGLEVRDEFGCGSVNDLPLGRLFEQAVTVGGDEVIAARHQVDNVRAANVLMNEMNGMDMNKIIDTSQENVYLDGNLIIDDLDVQGDVIGDFHPPCDLNAAENILKNPSMNQFDQIIVDGNLYWKSGQGEISVMLDKIVSLSRDAFVDAEVVFEAPIEANSIEYDGLVNEVDVGYILKDSLKKRSSEPQVVTGEKAIKGVLRSGKVSVSDHVETETVNDINILDLNRTLVRRDGDDYVTGDKMIEADVDIGDLTITNPLHGVRIEDLVRFGDERVIDEVLFESLTVLGDLYTVNVNNVNLNDFINASIKLNGPEQHIYGDVTFETLNIDECWVDSINGVPADMIVVDSQREQILVDGDMIFKEDVIVYSDADVDSMNGMDVRDYFGGAVLANEDANIEGDVVFKGPVVMSGDMIAKNTINDIDLMKTFNDGLKALEDSKKQTDLTVDKIKYNIAQIENIIKDFTITLLYADVVKDFNLTLSQFQRSFYSYQNDKVTLGLNGYHPGSQCNMPDYCLCPKNYMVTIEEDLSDSIQVEKYSPHRVYKLLSPLGISLELVTSSVSVSRSCIGLNEATWLSWRTVDQIEMTSTDLTQIVPGYVSDVKSFFSDGQYYAIVAQFYDKSYDTYNAFATVFSIDFNRKAVNFVQNIPTSGVWTINILEGNDGLHLILGNTFDSYYRTDEVYAQVLRFNKVTIQFESVQFIATAGGCKSIASAVVKNKLNFIILAQAGSNPLIIAKYDDNTKQYATYQLFTYTDGVKSTDVHYLENRNSREPFLFVTSSDEQLFIYQYSYSAGWNIHSSGHFSGIQGIVPFSLGPEHYFIGMSNRTSKIVSLVAQGVF